MLIIAFPICYRESKGGKMRFILYSLGRTLAERVIPIIGADYVNCPSMQRLVTLGCRTDDIILAHATALDQRQLLRAIHSHRSLIAFYSKDEISESSLSPFGYTVFISYDFSEASMISAIGKAERIACIFGTVEEQLAGSSEIMKETRKQIEAAARFGFPIHLTGETGTGKTLAAEAIHRASRIKKAMVRESCGLLSSDIAQSTLFGHLKGAFSGASDDRPGLLACADGSTLFLDEIQDLCISMQSSLLSVIETGNYRRLGSDRVCHSSFRLITAGNVDIQTLVDEKRMRLDFRSRIGFVSIRLPSLSEHMEDIPELIARCEEDNGYIGNRITDYAPFMHDFPGNVRQLYREVHLHHHGLLGTEH